MRHQPFFRLAWYAINLLLLASVVLVIVGITWEYSTRKYLKGFADAVVPLSASPEQKVEAILSWMRRGPARRTTADPDSLSLRDPEDTLNYQHLLEVCGSATNAFLNLAASSGLPARRLLLLGPDRRSRHVVAEVRLGDRWVAVDPAYHFVFRDAQGQLLTRQQLNDPQVLQEATRAVASYPPEYNFKRTAHIRLARAPVVGSLLQKIMDTVFPGWEEFGGWTVVLERESLAVAVLAVLLFCFALAGRFALSWYGEKRLGINRVRLREQLIRAGATLFSSPR